MTKKIFKVTNLDFDEIIVIKNQKSKSLKLMVNSAGKVQVSMPNWLPYKTGYNFALKNKQFIIDKMPAKKIYLDNYRFANNHHLKIVEYSQPSFKHSLNGLELLIYKPINLPIEHQQVQDYIIKVLKKNLIILANETLTTRLNYLAKQTGLNYQDIKIKFLRAKWGSCSNKKNITLNAYLVNLPADLIDYVLVHELVHTVHLNHSQDFKTLLKELLPNANILRQQLKKYNTYTYL